MSYRKKLIEVALPLEAINEASVREKSMRHGHPSTLHLWWARRPLAAARAVIFAQMVDDPSEYISELLNDPNLLQQAKTILTERIEQWEREDTSHNDELANRSIQNSKWVSGLRPTLESVLIDIERQRLFKIIEKMVEWENTTNDLVQHEAREEILRNWKRTCENKNRELPTAVNSISLPSFHDPFAGGGSLPLEAQRLGLFSYATDINPVAVLINKAMIEIPPRFADKSPINPQVQKQPELLRRSWRHAQGLAEDVHYYGQWMRKEAEKLIGHLYPKIIVSHDMVNGRPDLKKYLGQKLTVIAWIWARTVKSPNPAYSYLDVPLTSTFMLSTKAGKESYIEPVISDGKYKFMVKMGKPKFPEKTSRGTKLARANFECLMSGVPITPDYIKKEGLAGRIGSCLLSIIAEGDRERVYLSPTAEMEAIALNCEPSWKPSGGLVQDPRAFTPILYGITEWHDLFTSRQLVMLETFTNIVQDIHELIRQDARRAGLPDDDISFSLNGNGALAYADAVTTYLAFLINQVANHSSSLCGWNSTNAQMRAIFARQAIPMVWDYAESNPFSDSSGSFNNLFERQIKGFDALGIGPEGFSNQADALHQTVSKDKVVSTDPPYYDNVPYADLSDFFYVWLRRTLRSIYPELFATLAVPKIEELTALSYRHGSKEGAESFFLAGMTKAMHCLSEQAHPGFPITIYYAFKQNEEDGDDGIGNTGWETFLDAVINAGLAITGTWPIRTEREGRVRGINANALASSIVLVCRRHDKGAITATRREFVSSLKSELPSALSYLQAGNIAPVDLAQAAIGPGMAIYTRYSKVIDANANPISVGNALSLINQTVDEILAEQEGDFDTDTRWAIAWFEQMGYSEGDFGIADVLARAKDTSVDGMVEAGIVSAGHGKVRLLKPSELPKNWDPTKDKRLTTWEIVHHLIQTLEEGGENQTASLVVKLGTKAEIARELCYRLYTICERKKRTNEALSYNALVQSWLEITRLARENNTPRETQGTLF